MKVNLDILSKPAEKIVGLLHNLLADEYILLTKTRNYPWHVFGSGLHHFYDEHYKQLRQMVDQVSERATQLGSPATASVREFLEWTRLKNVNSMAEPAGQVKQLLHDHETVSRQIRRDIGQIRKKINSNDTATINLLTNFLSAHEKMSWTLRSYLGHTNTSLGTMVGSRN